MGLFFVAFLAVCLQACAAGARRDVEDAGQMDKGGVGDVRMLEMKDFSQTTQVEETRIVAEVHHVLVTIHAEQSRYQEETSQRKHEKLQLMARMERRHGDWNVHHPRYRLLDALHGYTRYLQSNRAELQRWRDLYGHVSRRHKMLLERVVGYTKKFSNIDDLLSRNQAMCDNIVQNALEYYGVDQAELDEHIRTKKQNGYEADRIGVSQALKHFVRDWSKSGISEREAAFPCILSSLEYLFLNRSQQAVRVVLPGAGLGRLGYEIADLGGFEVTNNEWSMFQNVAYRFLERHAHFEGHSVHPFVDTWSHHKSTADMIRPIAFPDTNFDPRQVVLVEGDFTTVFHGNTAAFDVVVTHFFIDTARNLMSYFETIHRILRPGGYWINFGPLLYGTGPFVQLALDEIVKVVEAMGFRLLEVPEACGEVTLLGEKVRGRNAVYGFDEMALTSNSYKAQVWIAQRL